VEGDGFEERLLLGSRPDDRPWRGGAPPAVVYSYAPGRSGEHAATLLQGYTGVLQTDGYAAYRSLADPKRVGGPATLAFCPPETRHSCRGSRPSLGGNHSA
jgi:hypothetical protein